ncbi:S-methyl-5-thioribose kinase [Andreprevotia chitinilytica]|uniref:S-methyl-5-thioribose kinase n=1 Tax=Andreprevotia chitinilytica TaxID=396808 RepID=UPI0005569D78|nr:S-methyl-5-thioribose kinase [Andreprevotia chitinilytica]
MAENNVGLPTPAGYFPLDDARLRVWLSGLPSLAAHVGGDAAHWRIDEVGDGNLNLVFLVRGTVGGVCVKQSLPYVRAVGESWPMPLERAFFEHQHNQIAGPYLAGLIPQTFHYDSTLYASVMELLSPHLILRQGLIAGRRYPHAATAVAEFVARSAVLTSPLAQPFEQVFDQTAIFSRNHALTRVTAELIFADPFEHLPRNRWTSPELDQDAADIRNDANLRAAVARLGHRFLTQKEALLHGDLHTGSVMVTEADTRVIDPEFAVYGPVGFDVGVFIANLLMAFFAQPGHASAADSRQTHAAWILAQAGAFWRHFAQRYDALWQENGGGDAWPARLFTTPAQRDAFARARRERLREIYSDALGFAGAEIIRRILGFAHNQDFEAIADPLRRADAERRSLTLARALLLTPSPFADMDAVLQHAQRLAVPIADEATA